MGDTAARVSGQDDWTRMRSCANSNLVDRIAKFVGARMAPERVNPLANCAALRGQPAQEASGTMS